MVRQEELNSTDLIWACPVVEGCRALQESISLDDFAVFHLIVFILGPKGYPELFFSLEMSSEVFSRSFISCVILRLGFKKYTVDHF